MVVAVVLLTSLTGNVHPIDTTAVIPFDRADLDSSLLDIYRPSMTRSIPVSNRI